MLLKKQPQFDSKILISIKTVIYCRKHCILGIIFLIKGIVHFEINF